MKISVSAPYILRFPLISLLTTVAVPCCAESLNVLRLESIDDFVKGGTSFLLSVVREPLHDVKVTAGIERVRGDGITVQVVGYDGLLIVDILPQSPRSHHE